MYGTYPAKLQVAKITQDTREIEPGDVFICIEGALFDGHTLANKAAEKGAVAIIAHKKISSNQVGGVPIIYVNDTQKAMAILAKAFYGNPSHSLTVIGVTGTNGKTTVTHMLDAIATYHGKNSGMVGTLGMRINQTEYKTRNTTPDSITMQRYLAKMVEEKIDICSLEVSSHALAQGRTWGIEVDVAILTNITQDHLDYHGTMEQYARAKELLFSQLGSGRKAGHSPIAVINKDDPFYLPFSKISPAEVISYSTKDKSADLYAEHIHYSHEGSTFKVHVLGENANVFLPLVGEYNVQNALAALGAMIALGVPLAIGAEALSILKPVKGRLQPIRHTKGYHVIVDYAHTPDGLEKVLTSLRPITEGRLISVFGCRGERDKSKRAIMGKIATQQADFVVFTTDEPGNENQDQIMKMILSEVTKTNYIYIPERVEAIKYAVQLAEAGDRVVITGRGHEEYYMVKGRKIPLVDAEVAQRAVDSRSL